MCRSRDAWTDVYAQDAGVGLVMRANMAPAGSETRETEREAKSPEGCSTRRRRVRSGWTQAGITSLALSDGTDVGAVMFPFVGGGALALVVVDIAEFVGIRCFGRIPDCQWNLL